MPYRLLVTNIPLYIEAEEFYDYIRAHTGGNAIVNALLIMCPDTTTNNNNNNNGKIRKTSVKEEEEKNNKEGSPQMTSSGAALVDYTTKEAAEAARRVDFYIDGIHAMMKAVGVVTTTTTTTNSTIKKNSASTSMKNAEAEAQKGREAYEQLRFGLKSKDKKLETTATNNNNSTSSIGLKRPREINNNNNKELVEEKEEEPTEVELRLVGIPCHIYGDFIPSGTSDSNNNNMTTSNIITEEIKAHEENAAVRLFMDIALSIRRATLGELLSLRRISNEEVIILVPTSVAEALLERAEVGLELIMYPSTPLNHDKIYLENDFDKIKEEKQRPCTLLIKRPRPNVRIDADNFTLVKKHEVLEAMAHLMSVTNAKVAGFIDPFGNLLFPIS